MDKHLDKIEDTGIREICASMIEKDPSNRKSAEYYVSQARGKVFPEYFYGFLHPYMQIFSVAPILSPDEKINRLKNDVVNIINMFKTEIKDKVSSSDVQSPRSEKIPEVLKSDSGESEDVTTPKNDESLDKSEFEEPLKLGSLNSSTNDDLENEEASKSEKCVEPVELEDGLIIITQLVTSCIRGLHHTESKLQSLEIMLTLSENISDETIYDRILPYIVSLKNFYLNLICTILQ